MHNVSSVVVPSALSSMPRGKTQGERGFGQEALVAGACPTWFEEKACNLCRVQATNLKGRARCRAEIVAGRVDRGACSLRHRESL